MTENLHVIDNARDDTAIATGVHYPTHPAGLPGPRFTDEQRQVTIALIPLLPERFRVSHLFRTLTFQERVGSSQTAGGVLSPMEAMVPTTKPLFTSIRVRYTPGERSDLISDRSV
jgi:hypothetical protein